MKRELAAEILSEAERSRRDLVRKEGLEPSRFYPPDPKSGASANSATFARRGLHCYCNRIFGAGMHEESGPRAECGHIQAISDPPMQATGPAGATTGKIEAATCHRMLQNTVIFRVIP